MNWFKIDVNEIIFIDLDDANDVREFADKIKMRALCAQFEGIPPEQTRKKLNSNPEHELDFIKPDIDSLIAKRVRRKTQYHQSDSKRVEIVSTQIQNNSEIVPQVDKIRLDKIRLDKISNGARFTPPTLTEVKEHIILIGSGVDAERFCNFYESKGWMIGKNKMKDWKAALRTWDKSDNSYSKPQKEDGLESWMRKQNLKEVF